MKSKSNTNWASWRYIWRLHRTRVRNAKPKLETSPPKLNIKRFIKTVDLHEDVVIITRNNRDNTDIMTNMNGILRTQGRVKPYLDPPKSVVRAKLLKENLKKLYNQEQVNKTFGRKLALAKGKINSHPFIDRKERRECEPFKQPVEILKKYSNLKLPEEPNMVKLFRPQVYIGFALKDMGISLRPLIVVLYTEACPEFVLALVRACNLQRFGDVRLKRIFPKLWMDCEISFDSKEMHTTRTEFDKRALDHGAGSGILSFNSEFLSQGILSFSISFRPLPVLNGKRVAFGRVCRGFKALESIEKFGTKRGTPAKPFTVVAMGILN